MGKSVLGGVMFNVLAIRLKVRGFIPCLGDGFLRTIKFASHFPTEGKESPRPHVITFYGMQKIPLASVNRNTSQGKSNHSVRPLPLLATR
jgi:hypothetical protein